MALQLTLCGQTPEVALQSALTAINFFTKQTDLLGQLRESKLQRRMEALHAQCNENLTKVHAAYTKQKARSAALLAQLQEAHADKEELHSKYQQRSRCGPTGPRRSHRALFLGGRPGGGARTHACRLTSVPTVARLVHARSQVKQLKEQLAVLQQQQQQHTPQAAQHVHPQQQQHPQQQHMVDVHMHGGGHGQHQQLMGVAGGGNMMLHGGNAARHARSASPPTSMHGMQLGAGPMVRRRVVCAERLAHSRTGPASTSGCVPAHLGVPSR